MSAPSRRGLFAAIAIGLAASALHPPASAQPAACEPEALRELASTITARHLGLPAADARSDRCVSVTVNRPELGPPVVARLGGSRCALVALAYRRTTVQTERCGYDVHFEPMHETGVAVFARVARGWRRIARGSLTLERLDALSTLEHEGQTSLALDGRRLAIQRRLVVLAP